MNREYCILAINPGSTSMKMAVNRDAEQIASDQVSYSPEELAPYHEIIDQKELRLASVRKFIASLDPQIKLDTVVGRGGVLPPLSSGAYEVNERMLNRIIKCPLGQHASNLGGILAYEIAQPLGIKAYIYDSVSVHELNPFACLTGHKDVLRVSRCHTLNMRAMAIRAAAEAGSSYEKMNQIIVHMGGGITLSAHEKGRMIDIVLDSEGPFSPERSGRIPMTPLLRYAAAHGKDAKVLINETRGRGGLVSLLGTNNALEVERRIAEGDKMAIFTYQTMAYQVAKAVGELSTVLKGKVDQIVLTGAIAYSKLFTGWITERVCFLANVVILPGEDELQSLCLGMLRVLRGEEKAYEYTQMIDNWKESDCLDVALSEMDSFQF